MMGVCERLSRDSEHFFMTLEQESGVIDEQNNRCANLRVG